MAGVLFARQRSSTPELAGFRVQSSVYGLPIPVIYGTARVAANLIDFIKGSAIPTTSQRAKWTSATQTGWTYLNAVAMALGEGTIAGIGNVWADKDAKADFASIVQPRDTWTLKSGTINQAALGFLSTAAPYQFIAYVAAPALAMPNNVLPNFSWEVKGIEIFGSGVVDALGSDILYDLLTNAHYGMSFPSASIDSLTDYEDYCAAAGLFFSPVYSSLRTGAAILDELMTASNSALVWSDGLLKVKPYGDQALSAHGHTYTPDVNPVYDLSDRDFLAADGEDPITVTRKNPNECFNQLSVEFENRANDYNVDTKEAKNDDDILATRLRPAPKLSLPLIKDPDVGRNVATLQQQRAQYVVNQYGFKLGWKFSLLEPMDLVTLTDAGLGLDFTTVRIVDVVELEDAAGIQITAEDWPFGAAGATLYPSQGGSGHKPDQNVTPGNTTVQIADAPPLLTNAYTGIWIGASGGVNWGGCEVWYSYDDVSYYKLGEITQKATFGTLTADFLNELRYPFIDTLHTLSVDTSPSGGVIETVDSSVFDASLSLIWLNGEWLIYRDAALTGTDAYDLTYFGRGLYNSPVAAPAHTGDPFLMVPPAFDATGNLAGPVFRWNNPGAKTGDVVYLKFPSFNVYGNELQSLAAVSPVTHTIAVDPSVAGAAIGQGTGAVDSNGDTTFSVQGAGWVQSYMYLTSTTDFPTDAAVLATGTIVDGRVQAGIVGPTLALQETAYATFIPFSGLQATGIAGQSFGVHVAYTNSSGSRTTRYAATAFFNPTSDNSASQRRLTWMYAPNGFATNTGAGSPDQHYATLPVAVGMTMTEVRLRTRTASTVTGYNQVAMSLWRNDTDGTSTQLGSTQTATSAGYSTLTVGSLSESVSAGRSYSMECDTLVDIAHVTLVGVGMLWFEIDEDYPDVISNL